MGGGRAAAAGGIAVTVDGANAAWAWGGVALSVVADVGVGAAAVTLGSVQSSRLRTPVSCSAIWCCRARSCSSSSWPRLTWSRSWVRERSASAAASARTARASVDAASTMRWASSRWRFSCAPSSVMSTSRRSAMSEASDCSSRARRSASSASRRARWPSASSRICARRVRLSSSRTRSSSCAWCWSASNSRRCWRELVEQLVGLGLGHAEDLRGAAGGAGAHVVHLVLGDAHHLLQPVAHAVDGARDGGQLGDLRGEALHLGAALGQLGAGGAGLAAADVELAGEALEVGKGRLAGGVGGVALGEELAEPLLDLRAVEAPPDDGEGQAVKVGCHRAERSSGDKKADAG